MNNTENYQMFIPDWRKQLATNEHRTKIVMGIFISIYTLVGFLVDVYINLNLYSLPTIQIAHLLLTFKLTPIATIVMLCVATLSILITFSLYDKIMLLGTNYREITAANITTTTEQQLYDIVAELQIAAGMHYLPKIYIIQADYMNAFASGYSEKSALIAVTTGLIAKLNRSELQAVIAHEYNHIKHQDIKLTLVATVLSNIILIVIDILFRGVIYSGRRRREDNNYLFLIIMLLRFTLPLLTVILLLYLSRTREYMADAGAVELTRDNVPLGQALLKISNDHEANKDNYAIAYKTTAHEDVRRSAYIFDPNQAGISIQQSIATAFSTHPPIKDRLKAIGLIKIIKDA